MSKTKYCWGCARCTITSIKKDTWLMPDALRFSSQAVTPGCQDGGINDFVHQIPFTLYHKVSVSFYIIFKFFSADE